MLNVVLGIPLVLAFIRSKPKAATVVVEKKVGELFRGAMQTRHLLLVSMSSSLLAYDLRAVRDQHA
ncbi:hypothetical protein [Paraburkholderia fungorum]|nr:hypothetical protein [Paraburkholderia fungorum]